MKHKLIMENWRKFVKEADTDNDGIPDEKELAVIDKGELDVTTGSDSWKELYRELWSNIGYDNQTYYKYDEEVNVAIDQMDNPVDAYMEIRDVFSSESGILEDDTDFLDAIATKFPEISKKIRYQLSPDYDPGPARPHDPNEPEEDL